MVFYLYLWVGRGTCIIIPCFVHHFLPKSRQNIVHDLDWGRKSDFTFYNLSKLCHVLSTTFCPKIGRTNRSFACSMFHHASSDRARVGLVVFTSSWSLQVMPASSSNSSHILSTVKFIHLWRSHFVYEHFPYCTNTNHPISMNCECVQLEFLFSCLTLA